MKFISHVLVRCVKELSAFCLCLWEAPVLLPLSPCCSLFFPWGGCAERRVWKGRGLEGLKAGGRERGWAGNRKRGGTNGRGRSSRLPPLIPRQPSCIPHPRLLGRLLPRLPRLGSWLKHEGPPRLSLSVTSLQISLFFFNPFSPQIFGQG